MRTDRLMLKEFPVLALSQKATEIENPLWEYLQANVPHADRLVGYSSDTYTPDPFDLRGVGFKGRHVLTREYSWAIPSPLSLAFILFHLDGRGVVEMGAGTGYWAWMLQQLGEDVLAYDLHPPDQDENWFHSDLEEYVGAYTESDIARLTLPPPSPTLSLALATHGITLPAQPMPPDVGSPKPMRRVTPGFRREVFHPIVKGGPSSLAAHPDRVLFLCWPPNDDPMAAEAVLNYTGDTIIYIGEGEGGCTGDDLFFHLLEEGWDEVDYFFHTAWGGIHDYISVFTRRAQA